MKTRKEPSKSRKVYVTETVVRRPSAFALLIPSLVIGVAILAVIAARIRLLDVPLERDEGEYGYLGQLILHGVAPYGVAANMKLPGTYLVYALVMAIFGQTTVAIHLGLLVADAISAMLVYGIGRRLFQADLFAGRVSSAALAAAGTFSVLSIGYGVVGLWAHATHFVILFALAATLAMLKWGESLNIGLLVAGGLLFGVAFIMKQPGILFAPMGAIWIVWNWRPHKNAGGWVEFRKHVKQILGCLVVFSVAVAAPFGAVCLWLWRAGVFDRFWFWTVTYGRQYGSLLSISGGLANLRATGPPVVMDAWAIWLLALVAALFELSALRKRSSAVFLLVFAVFSFAAVCPGLYFRRHYFVLLLPAVALLAGAFVSNVPSAKTLFGQAGRLWLVAIATVFPLLSQQQLLFELTPQEASKQAYVTSPFVEAIEVSKYIKEHTAEDSKIAILGSEPEIFVYSHRRSATPYIYIYSLMELHPHAARMQEEFIHDIETAAPQYIVLVNNEDSWLIQPGASKRLMNWWPVYGNEHYDQVGLADMLPEGTKYYWDSAATRAVPQAHLFICLLKRKGK